MGRLTAPSLYTSLDGSNQTFMSSKSETLIFDKQPSVEHIMPQDWVKNWPLPDGTKGIDFWDLAGTAETDPRAIATRMRQIAIQTLGNLTILSTGLNSAQSEPALGSEAAGNDETLPAAN